MEDVIPIARKSYFVVRKIIFIQKVQHGVNYYPAKRHPKNQKTTDNYTGRMALVTVKYTNDYNTNDQRYANGL